METELNKKRKECETVGEEVQKRRRTCQTLQLTAQSAVNELDLTASVKADIFPASPITEIIMLLQNRCDPDLLKKRQGHYHSNTGAPHYQW
eukprot:g36180.t1